MMDVTIVEQPELRIAGIRHIGSYQEIGREFGRLGGILKGPPPSGSQMIALFHDDPAVTPADHLRSDAALTLSVHTPAPDGLVERHVPAGHYARAVHKGGYEGLPAAWNALKTDWLPTSGHKMGSPSYEIYINNPMTVPKDDLLTEIFLRLD
jgi:AraC family transcriptional regulator